MLNESLKKLYIKTCDIGFREKIEIPDKSVYGGFAWFLTHQEERSTRHLEEERKNAN